MRVNLQWNIKGAKIVRANHQLSHWNLNENTKMARLCLVIFVAIFAFGLVTSHPVREEGLGALSDKVGPLMPRLSHWMPNPNGMPIPDWMPIPNWMPNPNYGGKPDGTGEHTFPKPYSGNPSGTRHRQGYIMDEDKDKDFMLNGYDRK